MPIETDFPMDENGDVLRNMQDRGDDLSMPRDIYFNFAFPTESQALSFAEQLNATTGLQLKTSRYEERKMWQVCVSKYMIPAHREITAFEKMLCDVAKIHDGEPDGWGCFKAVEKNMQPWRTKEITHEGFPLFLRYPENLNINTLKKKFSELVVVRHQLSKVSPNGLPEADYNESLFEFDQEIRDAFEITNHGVTVLVETFSGKRNYYIYFDSKKDVVEMVASLNQTFPQEKLSCTVHSDPDWAFISKYSKEFLQ